MSLLSETSFFAPIVVVLMACLVTVWCQLLINKYMMNFLHYNNYDVLLHFTVYFSTVQILGTYFYYWITSLIHSFIRCFMSLKRVPSNSVKDFPSISNAVKYFQSCTLHTCVLYIQDSRSWRIMHMILIVVCIWSLCLLFTNLSHHRRSSSFRTNYMDYSPVPFLLSYISFCYEFTFPYFFCLWFSAVD